MTNLFFLLSFSLTGGACYAVFRRLALKRLPALACSTLFALLPVHFFGLEDRVLLSAAYAVPLGAYLTLRLLSGAPLLERRATSPSRWRRGLASGTAPTLVMCVLIGSGRLYYAGFTIVLLLAAAVVLGLAHRKIRVALTGLCTALIIVLVLGANLAPSLLHDFQHGVNRAVAHRSPHDTEVYPLKLSLLVLPELGHRVTPFAHMTARYERFSVPPPNEAYGAALGLVGAIGLLVLGLAGLGACLGPCSGCRTTPSSPLLLAASAATAITFLIGTQGGISSLISTYITPQLRVWSRISMFIAFFSLLAVGLVLESVGRRLGRTSARRRGLVAVLVMVVLIGVVDQAGAPAFIPDYETINAEYRSDARLVAETQRELPAGAKVFELPYVRFPEHSTDLSVLMKGLVAISIHRG